MSDEFKLDYTDPDVIYKVNHMEEEPQEPEYDYYAADVSKSLVSTVYIRILKGTEVTAKQMAVYAKEAAKKLSAYDWEDDHFIEWDGHKPVDEEEATAYDTYNVD